jgi:serine/threonine protein kinase
MTPERFQLISQIYHRALECDPAERVTFLDQQCGQDRDLRREVELLLTGGKTAEAAMLSMAMQEAVRRLSDATPRNLVGETLDHYQVLSIIGVGGMGEVYRARDINLGREVAIKLLPTTAGSGSERLRLVREARAASALNHPNILTIHEIEQANDHHFIVAEFIEGETLRQRLTHGRIPINEALTIAIQVASALSAAHAAGIVHRDIKPENIMLRRDDLVKVLDFGLAKLTDSTTLTTTPEEPTMEWFHTDANVVLGTSAYMSPEQTRGLSIDPRTDIWSLGVVLYEMVTGSLRSSGKIHLSYLTKPYRKEQQ